MPKVSVIVPVYNTEKYISKCLDSLLAQTLADIEIICVNDCSTDGSLRLLQEYAGKDNRIKIIDFEKNQGAAVARNTAIEKAQGEYIGFVDSDDFVDLDFYEKLYNKAKEKGADAAKGNYKDAVTGFIDYNLNEKIKENKNCFAYAYCSAIFKRELVSKYNIKFPKLRDMEDPVFAYNFAVVANNVEIVDTNVNIVKRPNSVTSTALTQDRLNDKLEGLKQIIGIANIHNVDILSYCHVTYFWIKETFFNSLQTKDIELRKFLINELIKIYEQLKYKGEFIEKLDAKSQYFITCLQNEKIDDLLNFEKSYMFFSLRKIIKKNG